MASCELCGKSVAFMGGGKEPYTGKELYVCNECGILFKKLEAFSKEGNIEQFKVVNTQLLDLAKGKQFENIIVDFSDSLERKVIDKKRQSANEKQMEINKKAVAQKYEQLRESFLSTTGYSFDGFKIKAYKGIVSGEIVLGTGFISEFAASVSDMLGTKSDIFANKMTQAKQEALENLTKNALYVGGNALIGVDFDYITFNNNILGVSAKGTAVVIEKIE